MKLNDRQLLIVKFIQKNGEITSEQAVELIGNAYYCNKAKHTGEYLARMIKANIIERSKRGVFRMRTKHIASPENMPELFKS